MDGWSTPRPGRFAPRELPGTHCVGGWLGPRTGPDGCGKSRPPAVVRSPDSPVAVPTELSSARMMVDVPLLLPDRGVNRECMATRLPKPGSNLHLDDSCWYFISRSLKLCFCVSLFDPVKPRLNIQQFYFLPKQCICVFCVDLRTNSEYFPIQH